MNKTMSYLVETGAFLEGHFLLSSGRHSARYCQCAKLFMHPNLAEKAVSEVYEKMKGVDFDIVAGPAMGGIIAAYELSRLSGRPNLFVERVDGSMCLRRGFTIKPGQRVVVMEDVITTGKSTLETAEVLQEAGGIVVAAACIIDRQADDALPFPVYSALKLTIETFDSNDCPLCRQGMSIIKPGSRNSGASDRD